MESRLYRYSVTYPGLDILSCIVEARTRKAAICLSLKKARELGYDVIKEKFSVMKIREKKQ